MEIDGPVIVWYVVNGIALLAIVALIIMHFSGERSGIDWTLFQIYVLCGLSIISLMPPSLIYGAGVPQLIPIRGNLCVIQAQVSHFFILALRMFPILLCFELWWVVVMRKTETKNRFGLFGSLIIYLFCIGVTAAEVALEFNAPSMGVTPLRFYCSLQYDSVYSLTMEVPSTVCAAIGLGFTIHSTIHLYQTFRQFQKHPNRRLHIRRSLTVRLCIWAFVYTLISGVLAVNNLVLMVHNETGLTPREYNQPILEFAAAGSAIILLAIFGTTKKAAIFLPCFTLPSKDVLPRSKKVDSWDYETESQRGLTGPEAWQQTMSVESWPRSQTPDSMISLPPPRVNLTDSRVFEPSFTVEDIKFRRASMDGSTRSQSPGPNPFMSRTKNAVAVARAPEMEVMAVPVQMSSLPQEISRHQMNPVLPRQKTSASLTSVTLPPRIEPRMPNDLVPQAYLPPPPHAEPLRPIEPARAVMFRPPGYLESRFSWDSNAPATPRR